MAAVRYVVFDAVGTLIYACPSVAEIYCTLGQAHGWDIPGKQIEHRFRAALETTNWSPVNEEAYYQAWQQVVAHVFQSSVSATAALFQSLWRHFASSESWRLFPDAESLIRDLDDRNIPWVMASNFDRRLMAVQRGHDLLRRCQQVFCSTDLGFAKPERAFFDRIADCLNVRPEQLLMVGDSQAQDVIPARAAGWNAVWLRRGVAANDPSYGRPSDHPSKGETQATPDEITDLRVLRMMRFLGDEP